MSDAVSTRRVELLHATCVALDGRDIPLPSDLGRHSLRTGAAVRMPTTRCVADRRSPTESGVKATWRSDCRARGGPIVMAPGPVLACSVVRSSPRRPGESRIALVVEIAGDAAFFSVDTEKRRLPGRETSSGRPSRRPAASSRALRRVERHEQLFGKEIQRLEARRRHDLRRYLAVAEDPQLGAGAGFGEQDHGNRRPKFGLRSAGEPHNPALMSHPVMTASRAPRPRPARATQDARRVLLVTGLSGAGHSTALKALEDLGYEAVDNLPLARCSTPGARGQRRGRSRSASTAAPATSAPRAAARRRSSGCAREPALERAAWSSSTATTRCCSAASPRPAAAIRWRSTGRVADGIARERALLSPLRPTRRSGDRHHRAAPSAI